MKVMSIWIFVILIRYCHIGFHTYQGGVVKLTPPHTHNWNWEHLIYSKKSPILALVYIILDENHTIIQHTSSTDVNLNESTFAKYNRMKISIFIYICRKNTGTDFCTGNYSKATSNYNNKYNVGNWELVWHSLIRQNNVDICQSQTSFTLPHRTPIQKGCVQKLVVPSPLLLFKHKNFMPFQRPRFKIESNSSNHLKPLSRACVNSARIVLHFVTKYCFSTLWKCAYPCKTTMILHTCLPQHST